MTYGTSVYGSSAYGAPTVVTPTEAFYYFIPPVRYVVPTTVPERHPGNALFWHYGPRAEGVNIYLVDGVFTETPPQDVNDADHIFYGGHIDTVDTAMAELLIAAGYTVTPGSSFGYGYGSYLLGY